MPSVQEILVVGALTLLVIYLPKRAGGLTQKAKPKNLLPRISGTMRLAIVASLLWLALSAVVWHPWQGDRLPFIYWGTGPVVVAWSIYWVVMGFRRQS